MDTITCFICYYLLKVKIIIFRNFFDILFEIIKSTIKVKGLNFFNVQALKSCTRDMYHTPLSQI